jgi:anti-sigma factor (TIGR02949 family)
MACADVLELLEAHLDGDLSRDEAAAVSAHIKGCAGCAREEALADAVRAQLRELPEFDTPPRLRAAVRWAVGREAPASRRRLRPLLAAAAAVTLAIAIGAVWWQRSQTRPSLDDPEIARATAEARYALALVGEVGRRAAIEELLGERVVSPTVRGIVRSLGGPENREHRADRSEASQDQGGTS